MNNNFENITNLVKLLKLHEINQIVISPGGTNIPLVKLLQSDDFFVCYSVVDERSAAYFAIGIYLQLGRPVALLCTSAQATRNYIPGLTEAFYKRVPILAITMEKHPRFKYQEYMQAPDQTSLPNDSVKKSFELPFICDNNDMYHSIRLINEAIIELSLHGLGPVQLCVPWLDFSIGDNPPDVRIIKRYANVDLKKVDISDKKILIVIGEHRPFSDKCVDAINNFCKRTNTVIYVNHLSNFQNEYCVHANLVLSSRNAADLCQLTPDILISIGGQTGDYPFYCHFSKANIGSFEHWRVSEDNRVVDTYDRLTKIFGCTIDEFFNGVSGSCKSNSYFERWNELTMRQDNLVKVPFSNVSIAQYLHDKIQGASIIQFSILNSLRVWNLFELDPSIECYCNVGAFGIDGGMSTAIGQSVVSSKPTYLVVGDLAFFYDMNSLGIRHIKSNLRILLINNDGGIEFKLHGENRDIMNPFIAAGDHHLNAEGWAISCGFEYLSASNMNEFVKASAVFINGSDKPILLEVFVSDTNESEAYLSIIEANRDKSNMDVIKSGIKNSIKNIVGTERYRGATRPFRKI